MTNFILKFNHTKQYQPTYYQIKLNKNKIIQVNYCCPRSNWGPLVCKTNVISTTPQQPTYHEIKLFNNHITKFFLKLGVSYSFFHHHLVYL